MRSACGKAVPLVLSLVVAATSHAQGLRTPRTPWGDPDLQGVYTNINEQRVPMERPDRFAGRSRDSITIEELEQIAAESNAAALSRGEPSAFAGLSPQRFDLRPSRPWLVVDPKDGRIPPLTPLGEQRRRQYAARNARRLNQASDSNLWYRCISIGVPRSMMPLADGATFRFVQSPGVVAIQYELMHEARVISLNRRPHVSAAVTAYMGDTRGRWEGDTLVVETTSFRGSFQLTSAAGPNLRVVERFTPSGDGGLEWSVTIDDPSAWTQPWTFSIPLARLDDSQGPLEYACHEGNHPLRNMLSAARAEETGTAPRSSVPRTTDGRPDFEGVWNFASLTPLERPARFAGRPFMSDEEGAAFERELLEAVSSDTRGADGALDLRGPAINEFWFERGRLSTIGGRKPTSLIVDPPDGRIPAPTPESQRRQTQRAASTRRFDGPADFSLSERCLRSASGPPYLPGAPDANLIRITQTPDHLAIVQEKYHETRVVPLAGQARLSPSIRTWTGDARAKWEGDTLVIETANFTRQMGLSARFDENLRIVERLTRVTPETLLYEFTVDDPTSFSRPWTVRLPMTRTNEELFEFACHEGNYSLPNILRGARFEERGQSTVR